MESPHKSENCLHLMESLVLLANSEKLIKQMPEDVPIVQMILEGV
jgi:hypothetical protein